MLYGSAYLPYELEICWAPDPANGERLAAALAPFVPVACLGWDPAACERRLNGATGRIRLLTALDGVGEYANVLTSAVRATAFDRDIKVLSLPAVICARRAAERRAPAVELEALLEAVGDD